MLHASANHKESLSPCSEIVFALFEVSEKFFLGVKKNLERTGEAYDRVSKIIDAIKKNYFDI